MSATQVCKHCPYPQCHGIHIGEPRPGYRSAHEFEPVAGPASLNAPAGTVGQSKELSDLLDDYRTQIVREMASQPCAPSEVRAEILSRFAAAAPAPAEHQGVQPVAGEGQGEQLQKVYDYFMGPHACGNFTCSCNKPDVCGICELRQETEAVLRSATPSAPHGGQLSQQIAEAVLTELGDALGLNLEAYKGRIEAILRPFITPASTQNRDAVKWLVDMGYGVNGRFDLNTKREWYGYEIKEILELFALGFPESGRTDPTCKHIWLPSPKGKGYSCGVCSVEKI